MNLYVPNFAKFVLNIFHQCLWLGGLALAERRREGRHVLYLEPLLLKKEAIPQGFLLLKDLLGLLKAEGPIHTCLLESSLHYLIKEA